MDINAPRDKIEKSKNEEEELFVMDDDSKSVRTSTSTSFTQVSRLELAHSLDVCLEQMFNYLYSESHQSDSDELDFNKFKDLFNEILIIFEHIILPTYDTHHVQYALFYLCSFKPLIAESFINFLWKFCCNPNKSPVLRQAAVNYIASFSARATFVTSSMLKYVLQNMANWIHKYISAQDELGPVNSDVRIHRVFYSVCQALFYIVAFRHKSFVKKKKNITFLESLNMGRIITSKLNPLKVCQSAVVQNFAAVTRNYQLVYCYTVIEHNSRTKIPVIYQSEQGSVVTSDNILDAIFPFDPYVLERSSSRIQPFYREFHEFTEVTEESTAVETDSNEMEIDDFLFSNEANTPNSSRSHNFSYSSSPGFKFKM